MISESEDARHDTPTAEDPAESPPERDLAGDAHNTTEDARQEPAEDNTASAAERAATTAESSGETRPHSETKPQSNGTTRRKRRRSRQRKMRVNYPGLAIAAATCLLVAVGVAGIHLWQVQRLSAGLLSLADKSIENDEPQTAIRHLRAYLGYVPDDVNAQAKLARLLNDSAESPRAILQAILAMEAVLNRDAERPELRRTLVDRLAQFRRWKDVLDHVTVLRTTSPDDRELMFLAARGHEEAARGQAQGPQRTENLSQAVLLYHRLTGEQPPNWEAFERLARLTRREQQKVDEADRIMGDMVSSNPKAVEAYLVRARYRRSFDNVSGALEDVRSAENLEPDRLETLLLRARLTLINTDATDVEREAVRQQLAKHLETNPEELQLYLLLAELERLFGEPQNAIDVLLRGREALPEQPEIVWRLSELLIAEEEFELAEQEIGRLRELPLPPRVIKFIEALKLLQEGDLIQARALFEDVRSHIPYPELKPVVALQLATCYGRMGLFEKQLTEYASVVENVGNSVEVELGQADALAALGRIPAALEKYRPWLSSPEIYFKYVPLLVEHTQRQPAEERNWRPVEDALNQTLPVQFSLRQELLRAIVLQAQRRFNEAHALLGPLKEKYPDSAAVAIADSRLAVSQGDFDQAAETLQQVQEKHADRLSLRLAWIENWTRQADDRSTEELRKLEQATEEFTPEQSQQLRQALADAHANLGNFNEAFRIWKLVADAQPVHVPTQFKLGMLALQSENLAAVSEPLARLEEVEGSGGTHTATLAAFRMVRDPQAKEKSRTQARDMLTRVVDKRPDWPTPRLLLAGLDHAAGERTDALDNYERAIENGVRDPAVLRRAVELAFSEGRLDLVEQLLGGLRDESPAGVRPALDRMASFLSLRQGNLQQAVAEARNAVAAAPNEWRHHLWLGALVAAGEQPDDALPSLRQAVELAPDQPDPYLALVRFLVMTDRNDEAKQVVDAAETNLEAEQHLLQLAHCHELVENNETARERYETALAKHGNDPAVLGRVAAYYLRTNNRVAAEPLLRKLLNQPGLRTSQKLAARRALADILSRSRDYRRFTEALSLLDDNVREAADSRRDQLVKARVLAGRSIARHLGPAKNLFEVLSAAQPLTRPDALRLAELYETLDQYEKADQQWESLLSADPDNLQMQAAYAGALLRREDTERASQPIRKLEQAAPADFGTVRLAVRHLVLRNRHQAAVDRLRQWIAQASDPAAQTGRKTRAAALLSQLSAGPKMTAEQRQLLLRPAEDWYRELLPTDADYYHPLAGVLVLSGRVDEALDLCDQARESQPLPRVLTTAVSVLRRGPADAVQIGRVEAWFEIPSPDESASLETLVQLADFRLLQERYDDAIHLYQRVLKQQPEHVVALNNLAWLLSTVKAHHDEALETIEHAIELAGPATELLDTRAGVLMNAGQHQQAIKDLLDALVLSQTPSRYLHLARAYSSLDGGELAAKENLQSAIDAGLDPARLSPFDRTVYQELVDVAPASENGKRGEL